MALALFVVTFLVLLAGFPVAFTLAGVALLFALAGSLFGFFDPVFLQALPNRMYGVFNNVTLMAVPLFVLMGITLERSQVAEKLLEALARLFGGLRGGMAFAVVLVGTLLAASTGIVGATVVTLGLLALPAMNKAGYKPSLSAGTLCATGTLGQIIPPSIVLVLLGDVLSAAYQQAQLSLGIFSPKTVSVGELFAGALIPGLCLVGLYLLFLLVLVWLKPHWLPKSNGRADRGQWREFLVALVAPLVLILAVLGSILGGLATPTEAAAVGAFGALLLAALQGRLSLAVARDIGAETVRVTAMVFLILLAASVFGLVFRGLGGETWLHGLLSDLPGGQWGAILMVMLVVFLLGFLLDFIEITFVVVPLVAPPLLAMGVDPIWLGVMLAVNLQTSFLTPPFGFALFYLRGAAPDAISTGALYRGVLPFVAIQLGLMAILALVPALATWLPSQLYQ
ncbi:TRAP transporter large permease subunit [Gallaecimonas sp. GXIMD4217]|uniref:TRAP transporter large permease n=1 Tax=Gallaecimonas sp. GXIMD4217 TaxID=3131927 RepID=UPI00311B2E93